MAGENQLIFGFHAVHARLRHHPDTVREVFVHAERHDARLRDLIAAAQERGARVVPVDAQRLNGLIGHGKHQGVVARVDAIRMAHDLEDIIAAAGAEALLLVLDGITDPHNLGACLRVADALGVHAVVCPKDRSAGLTPTVAKVASGAAETVPFIPVTNLARALSEMKEQGLQVIGADPSGTESLPAAELGGPLAWVLGAEGEGMRRLTRERCDRLVIIPMLGGVQTLNVSVASALCLYETRRQRAGAPASRLSSAGCD
jgi:23S rRNA (guanosine2251-2'-O)-methyltransferase